MSFPCPRCGHGRTRTIDSRPKKSTAGPSVARRRRCPRCAHAFSTREHIYDGPHNHKLTAGDVQKIRQLRTSEHLLHRELAAMFNVTQSAISRVLNHERWN